MRAFMTTPTQPPYPQDGKSSIFPSAALDEMVFDGAVPFNKLPAIRSIEMSIRLSKWETAWQRQVMPSDQQPFGPMQLASQAELFKRYPQAFRLPGPLGGGSQRFSVFDERGVECGDGWLELVDCLAQATEQEIATLALAGTEASKWPRVAQIKAKMGTLRFTLIGPRSEALNDLLIKIGESDSRRVCEHCGGLRSEADERQSTYCSACENESGALPPRPAFSHNAYAAHLALIRQLLAQRASTPDPNAAGDAGNATS